MVVHGVKELMAAMNRPDHSTTNDVPGHKFHRKTQAILKQLDLNAVLLTFVKDQVH